MAQRINASRVLFSVNMKSPITEKPRSPNRKSNNMSLRAVSPPESHPIKQTNFYPIAPPSDRRMSRRMVSNQTIMPRAISRPQSRSVPASPVQEFAEYLEVDTQPLTDHNLSEQVEINKANYKTAALIPPVYTLSLPQSEAAEIEEPYSIDRPVYLLSQKYFGTRY